MDVGEKMRLKRRVREREKVRVGNECQSRVFMTCVGLGSGNVMVEASREDVTGVGNDLWRNKCVAT